MAAHLNWQVVCTHAESQNPLQFRIAEGHMMHPKKLLMLMRAPTKADRHLLFSCAAGST